VTTYQEGPFRRWQAVSFGGLTMTVIAIFFPIRPNGFIEADQPGSGDTNDEIVAPYRKVWVGSTSGKQIDARFIPIRAGPDDPRTHYFLITTLSESPPRVVIAVDPDPGLVVDETMTAIAAP